MAWIIGIVILVLLVVSAGFRKFAIGLVVIGGIVGYLIYLNNERKEREELSKISASELSFEGLMLKPEYGNYHLVGRLKNNSTTSSITDVTVNVTMRDCTDETEKNCIVIGESSAFIYMDVPPGQARDFDDSVYFPDGIHPKGRLSWSYSIGKIRGK